MAITWERRSWDMNMDAFAAAFGEVDEMMKSKPELFNAPAGKSSDADDLKAPMKDRERIEFTGKTKTGLIPELVDELVELCLKFVEVQDQIHGAAKPGEWPLVLCWIHPEGAGEFGFSVLCVRKYEEVGSGTVRLWSRPLGEMYDELPDPDEDEEAFEEAHEKMMADAKELFMTALQDPRAAGKLKALAKRLGATIKYQRYSDAEEEDREEVEL